MPQEIASNKNNVPDSERHKRDMSRAGLSATATQKTELPKGDLRVKRVELVVRCQELARFLRGFNEQTWAEWLEDRVRAIRHESQVGVEELLHGFCGIGALCDVYLCPEAGHSLNTQDENAINEQFLLMLAKVNNVAGEIRLIQAPGKIETASESHYHYLDF